MILVDKAASNSLGRIGLAVSEFNSNLTESLRLGAVKVLQERGVGTSQLRCIHVPGALELPLASQILMDQGCIGVIALGVVIRGETSHYDLVCSGAQAGCMQVSLTAKRPVIFGVVTTENLDQANDRIGGGRGHKGEESARALLKMIDILRKNH